MLRDFLTPKAFEIGIVRYLKRYSYQNTVNSHLWESLTNVSSKKQNQSSLTKKTSITSAFDWKTENYLVKLAWFQNVSVAAIPGFTFSFNPV